jgi:hypothetical protein
MTGNDRKTAQSLRTPLERLLDNDTHLAARLDVVEPLNARAQTPRFVALVPETDIANDQPFIAASAENRVDRTAGVVLLKGASGDSKLAYDEIEVEDRGDMGVVSDLHDAAVSSSRIVAVGAGGNQNAYSDNAGTTWTSGGSELSGTIVRVIYSPGGDNFLTFDAAGTTVFRSANAVAWASATVPTLTAIDGMAAIADGRVLVHEGEDMYASDDDGASFSAITSDLAAASSLKIGGCPDVAELGDYFYAVRTSGSTFVNVHRSPDGETWEQIAQFQTPGENISTTLNRFLVCPLTGLMVFVARNSGGERHIVWASANGGVTWSGPVGVKALTGTSAFAVAGGKIFFTRLTQVYASQRLGF